MRRLLLVAVLAAFMVVVSAGAAFAGEWNKGHFNEPGGNIPATEVAESECLYNGQDETDETDFEEGDGEPIHLNDDPPPTYIGDDGLWSSTPAGAHNAAGVRVQSGGQITATGAGPVGQGEACNPNENPRGGTWG